MEGGGGDHILAHRFSVGIKNKYPNSELHVFSDTENNFLQKNILEHLYPNFYSSITVIPNKKYQKMVINSQFGEEEYRGNINNIPDDIREKMINDCDKFYSLHIDSLEFLSHDYDFHKYFYTIPAPQVNSINYIGPYICSQLISGSSKVHRLEQWYLERLILDIDQLCQKLNIRHMIITTQETLPVYESVSQKTQKSHIYCDDINGVCDVMVNSLGFIGIDSAWRLISYSQNKPTITLSKDCQGYGGVPISHQLRWLIYPKTTFGLHHNTKEILDLFEKMMQNKLYLVMPELAFVNQDINNVIIKRDYKVNIEKTK
jgi:hypothetical protein